MPCNVDWTAIQDKRAEVRHTWLPSEFAAIRHLTSPASGASCVLQDAARNSGFPCGRTVDKWQESAMMGALTKHNECGGGGCRRNSLPASFQPNFERGADRWSASVFLGGEDK
jgi:hypothetical protein